jgi:hypothetical protein
LPNKQHELVSTINLFGGRKQSTPLRTLVTDWAKKLRQHYYRCRDAFVDVLQLDDDEVQKLQGEDRISQDDTFSKILNKKTTNIQMRGMLLAVLFQFLSLSITIIIGYFFDQSCRYSNFVIILENIS